MRTTELSKKLSVVNFILITGLVLGVSTFSKNASASELAENNNPSQQTSDSQFRISECKISRTEMNDKKDDFVQSCTKAGLSSDVVKCAALISECEGDDSKSSDKCLNKSLTTADLDRTKDRAEKAEESLDKIDEKIASLQADYQEAQNTQVELNAEKNKADADFKNFMAQIDNSAADEYRKADLEIKRLDIKIEEHQEEITKLYLDLSEFKLQNDLKCYEEASEYKRKMVLLYKKRSKRPSFSQNYIFKTAGLSVNDLITIKADKKLKNCTMPFINVKGVSKTTAFGRAFLGKQKVLKANEDMVKRRIKNTNDLRNNVYSIRNEALTRLARQQADALVAQSKDNALIAQKKANADENKKQIAKEISAALMQRSALQAKKKDADNALTVSYKKIKPGADEKKAAFIEATANRRSYLSSVKEVAGANSTCNYSTEVAKLLKDFKLDDSEHDEKRALASSKNEASSTSTSTENSSANGRGRNTSKTSSDTVNTDGQTVSR